MRFLKLTLSLMAALAAVMTTPVVAKDTEVTVRVLSRDAKFIGSSMGGMRVVLRDARTDERLAQGVTAGGTGDTARIMHDDGGRRQAMADDSAADFTTTLDLERPRLVEATVYGPLAQQQAAHTASATQWVVPGKDLSVGDGWVIELPGFVVNILSPAAAGKIDASQARGITVQANVMMMCGCPIKPGGLWDADRYEVAMTVRHDGDVVAEGKLSYAGQASRFAGELPLPEPGTYSVTVYAYDPGTGNTGVDRTTMVIR